MKPLSLEQVCQVLGAALILNGVDDPAARIIQSVRTDTRAIEPGCLFIAIKGETHDGHHHLQAARDSGAIAALVDCDVPAIDLPLLRVDDTKKAMGRLANFVRRQFKGQVIAVAGSNGKTGTKNLVHSALKGALTGTISPKSFNNDIGVPTTIFDAPADDDYLVLEIGTNHPGEILNLTKIAEPDIAIITNIGAEHLEFLGDLEGVTKENAQIIEGLNPAGLLVLNGDFPQKESDSTSTICQLLQAVVKYEGAKLTFGFDPHNELHPANIQCLNNGVTFHLKDRSNTANSIAGTILNDQKVFIPLMGRHTAVNALAAIAVARHLGVEVACIFAGLSTATGPEMRLQLQTAGSVKILNDAYNANPHSMQAGLETLREMESPGRRVAILGDMRELGTTADFYHHQVGQFAGACELDLLVCVGEKAAMIASAAIESGMDRQTVMQYPNATACASEIAKIVSENDLVLLKASRGMKLEAIATAINALAAGAGLRRAVESRSRRVLQTSRQPSVTPQFQ